jgi:hypothetical protein
MRVRVAALALYQVGVEERVTFLLRILDSLSPRFQRVLSRIAAGAAMRMRDGALLICAYDRLGERAKGVARAIDAITASPPTLEAISRLESLPIDARVAWCLEPSRQDWTDVVVARGPTWIRESHIEPSVLAASCARLDHGPRLFAAWLEQLNLVEATHLLTTLDQWPLRLIRLGMQSSQPHEGLLRIVDASVASLSSETLFSSELLAELETDRAKIVLDRIVVRALPLVAFATATGNLMIERPIISTNAWKRWFSQNGTEVVRRLCSHLDWRDALPNVWRYSQENWPESGSNGLCTFAAIAFREANAAALDSVCTAFTSWLRTTPVTPDVEWMAAEALVAVRRSTPTTSPTWLEASFQTVYTPVYNNWRDPLRQTTWRPGQYEWDVGHNWREWLARTWFERRWPAADFLRTMRGDRQLLNDCMELVRYKSGSLQFAEALAESAQDPTFGDLRPSVTQWVNRLKPSILKWFFD